MSTFSTLVADELVAARANHGPMTSLHHGYAVILEEVDELWAEVKKRSSQRDTEKVLVELVQIAAMAQRAAEDMGLLK